MNARDRREWQQFLKEVHAEIGVSEDRVQRRILPNGRLPAQQGGTGTSQGAEPPLPAADGVGYVLVSGPDNARLWVPLIAGAGITIERNPTTGAITISVTASIQTLTFGGDDLTWNSELLTWGEA